MIETGTIPERLWPDAMSLLFAQEASDSKAGLIQSGIERLRNEVDAREGLVGLWADDQVLLAAWLLRSDAESAMFGSLGIQPTALKDSERIESLFHELLFGWHVQHGIRWSQALFTHLDSQRWRSFLENGGYTHIATLQYMHLPMVKATQDRENFPSNAEFVSRERFSEDRLREVVQQTFVETMDCPVLCEHRGIEPTIRGFRETGDVGDRHWYILVVDGRDAGCILPSIHQANRLLEWTYVGLAPWARGQGWGNFLARFGIRLARVEQCTDIALAVDSANTPAINLYQRHGFAPWDTRDVYVKWDWNQTSTEPMP